MANRRQKLLPPFQGDVDAYLTTPLPTLIRQAGARPARETPRGGNAWGMGFFYGAVWVGGWFLLMVGIHLWGWH